MLWYENDYLQNKITRNSDKSTVRKTVGQTEKHGKMKGNDLGISMIVTRKGSRWYNLMT